MSEVQTRSYGANAIGLPLADDLLHGAEEIARFVYGPADNEKASESYRRRVYHAADKHGLPAFKLGGTLTARKSTILKWIDAQEQASVLSGDP